MGENNSGFTNEQSPEGGALSEDLPRYSTGAGAWLQMTIA